MSLRTCEYVPPMPMQNEVLRRLRGLPSCWEQRVVESTVDSLRKRADALGRVLAKHRRKRETDDLRRRVSLLDRADELHRHAADVETLVGLYRALRVFTHEREPLEAVSKPGRGQKAETDKY